MKQSMSFCLKKAAHAEPFSLKCIWVHVKTKISKYGITPLQHLMSFAKPTILDIKYSQVQHCVGFAFGNSWKN